jgi:hypothetical protein
VSRRDAVLSIGIAGVEAAQQQHLVFSEEEQVDRNREFCTHGLIILFQRYRADIVPAG